MMSDVDVQNEWMCCMIICSGKISGVGIATTVLISQATSFGFIIIFLFFVSRMNRLMHCRRIISHCPLRPYAKQPDEKHVFDLLPLSRRRCRYRRHHAFVYVLSFFRCIRLRLRLLLCAMSCAILFKIHKLNGSVRDIHFT